MKEVLSPREMPWQPVDILVGLLGLAIFRALFYVPTSRMVDNFYVEFYLVDILLFLIWLIVIPIYLSKRKNIRFNPFKTKNRTPLKEALLAIPLFLGVLVLEGLILLSLEGLIPREYQVHPMYTVIPYNPTLLIKGLLFTNVLIIGPIAEEIFYRGFLYNALKSQWGVIIALIVQAAMFASFHSWDWWAISSTFLSGLVLAGIYELRRNLWAPIFVHVYSNLLLLIVAF